jgi:hypothetical protein
MKWERRMRARKIDRQKNRNTGRKTERQNDRTIERKKYRMEGRKNARIQERKEDIQTEKANFQRCSFFVPVFYLYTIIYVSASACLSACLVTGTF